MKKKIVALIFAALPMFGFAADGAYPLDKVNIDLTDKAAMQDGLKTFANYCMGCHGAKFQRYERVANDLGISEEQMMENIVFTDAKIGDHMKSAMTDAQAKQWFGAAPPDLTMIARVRGSEWLYNYMRTFYEDKSRPFGANNKVFKDVGMPNVLVALQGNQVRADEACTTLTIEPDTGSMSAAEFDETIKNLVTFLEYSANPVKLKSQRIGTYVLIFLVIFFVFAYLLKREYWKDIK